LSDIFFFFLLSSRKWSIVLRTQLSVRVHACIGMIRLNQLFLFYIEFDEQFI